MAAAGGGGGVVDNITIGDCYQTADGKYLGRLTGKYSNISKDPEGRYTEHLEFRMGAFERPKYYTYRHGEVLYRVRCHDEIRAGSSEERRRAIAAAAEKPVSENTQFAMDYYKALGAQHTGLLRSGFLRGAVAGKKRSSSSRRRSSSNRRRQTRRNRQ